MSRGRSTKSAGVDKVPTRPSGGLIGEIEAYLRRSSTKPPLREEGEGLSRVYAEESELETQVSVVQLNKSILLADNGSSELNCSFVYQTRRVCSYEDVIETCRSTEATLIRESAKTVVRRLSIEIAPRKGAF